MDNPTKIDELGVPLFQETSTLGCDLPRELSLVGYEFEVGTMRTHRRDTPSDQPV